MILTETDARFTLADSVIPGAGRGVFAKVPLAMGDELAVIGVLIPRDTLSDECTRYADDYKVRVGDKLLIPVGLGGMVNHSSQSPNMEKVIKGDAVFLRAIRSIEAGEELLFRYSDFAREKMRLDS